MQGRYARKKPASAVPRGRGARAPARREAHYALSAACYAETGDANGAREALRRAVALDPRAAKAQYALGRLLLESGDAAAAREPMRRACDLAPANTAFREGLAIALLEAGDLADAETELRARLALEPVTADAHNLLGVALWRRGERGAAAEQFRQALRLAPGHQAAAGNLGRALPEARLGAPSHGGSAYGIPQPRISKRSRRRRSKGGLRREAGVPPGPRREVRTAPGFAPSDTSFPPSREWCGSARPARAPRPRVQAPAARARPSPPDGGVAADSANG